MTLSRWVRLAAMLLISALVSNSLASAASKPPDPAVMKGRVQARGVGQGVRVTLVDKTEAKGLIVSIADQSFTLKAKRATQPQEIQFAQVTGVYNSKLGTGTKVIIAVAIVGIAIAIVAVVFVHKFDNSLKNINICPTGQCI